MPRVVCQMWLLHRTGTVTDYEIGINQIFEPGGRRSARIDAAEASVARETATSDASVTQIVRDVAISFVRALQALIIMAVFVPLFGMTGIEGRMYYHGAGAETKYHDTRCEASRHSSPKVNAFDDPRVSNDNRRRCLGPCANSS